MLLKVLKLEELNALIRHFFGPISCHYVINLEKEVYHSASAVLFCLIAGFKVGDINTGLLLFVLLAENFIWEVSIAALVG